MIEEKIYTESELTAKVDEAIKFVNECNARQAVIIGKLRLEIAALKGENSEDRTIKNIGKAGDRRQSGDGSVANPMDFVPLADIRNIST